MALLPPKSGEGRIYRDRKVVEGVGGAQRGEVRTIYQLKDIHKRSGKFRTELEWKTKALHGAKQETTPSRALRRYVNKGISMSSPRKESRPPVERENRDTTSYLGWEGGRQTDVQMLS